MINSLVLIVQYLLQGMQQVYLLDFAVKDHQLTNANIEVEEEEEEQKYWISIYRLAKLTVIKKPLA